MTHTVAVRPRQVTIRRFLYILGAGCLLLLLWPASAGQALAPARSPAASLPDQQPYPIGSPILTDLWVDPVHGDDGHSGANREQALATIRAAWARIPQDSPLTETGYRINLVAGDYPEGNYPNYWEKRHGVYPFPIILTSADGPGMARLSGHINVFDVDYLYLLGLRMENTGDVFHCEQCSHILIRGSTLRGGDRQAHETIKMNQSQHVYIEDSDISSSYENAVDFVAVQYGHILNNRIHDADDWCMYLKGGAAYFLIAGNEIYNCGTGGFTAGQGTGFEYMTSPWLHYEAYDIKFVNNVVHDTEGAGFGVNGGYDILLAYNTLYRVGSRSHGLEFVFGLRGCDGDATRCSAHRGLGGWGPTVVGSDQQPIPNRNIYVYNNLLYNPAPFHSEWQHLAIYGPRTPDPGAGIPNPARTDDNLRIRGNLIWNGLADLPLGIEEADQGCRDANPTCNRAQLLADNTVNVAEPNLVDPAGGNFRPAPGSMTGHRTFPLPDFPAWDALTPAAPAGDLTNRVPADRDGRLRPVGGGPAGAYAFPLDWGDAPDPPYLTTAASGGASHVISSLYLGSAVDSDADGQPSVDALGDDNDGDGDDEDGVVLVVPLWALGAGWVDVTVSAAGYLNAWIDFHQVGHWDLPDGRVFVDRPVVAGVNRLMIVVPSTAALGQTYARFRVSTMMGLSPGGPAPDGEVEDYRVTIWGQPHILLEKTVSLDGVCPGNNPARVAEGATVTYCYRVTNSGRTYLKDIRVTDDKLGEICTTSSLSESGDFPTGQIVVD